jgi:hypothetical protein
VNRTLRNVLIVLALAGAVYSIPEAGRSADFVNALLQVGIYASFVWIGVRVYRDYRVTIDGLGPRYRAMLYAAIALAVFDMAARVKLWETSAGIFVWFVIAGAVSYSLVAVWRRYRAYD